MCALLKELDVGTVFVLCGAGQSRSLPHYLAASELSLEKTITAPIDFKAFESLIQKDSPQITTDKLALVDIMMQIKENKDEVIKDFICRGKPELVGNMDHLYQQL